MKVWFPVIKTSSGTDIFTIRLAESLEKYGIETLITWFPWYFEIFPFLLRLYPTPKVDLIHANSWNAFAFYRKYIPLVTTIHLAVLDPAYNGYKSTLQWIYHTLLIRFYEGLSFSRSSAITAVSHYTATVSQSIFRIPQIETIYNYLDMRRLRDNRSSENDDGLFHLLFVGNASRRKGVDLLRPIMEKLGPEYRLTIISNSDIDPVYIDSANITVVGPKYDDDLFTAYYECDAVLFPTRLEGFGFVALEAMACGKPVISSRNSSLPEVVEHGVTGILCETGNIGEYVSACEQLRNNPTMTDNMGNAAKKRAQELFSEEVSVPHYIDLYNRVLGSSQ